MQIFRLRICLIPTPETNYEVIKTEPSEEQKEILKSLSERADDVRNRVVEPDVDNMLKKLPMTVRKLT